jgi:hypothetical protein
MALLARALEITPWDGRLHLNVSFCYEYLGDLLMCEQHLWAAILDPTVPEAREKLAICLKGQNKVEQAIAMYQFAQLAQPEPNRFLLYEESEMHLLRGDYARGWALYENRWALHRMGTPEGIEQFWRLGQDLHGKTIFVFCEQGIGDTVMHLRYLHLLKDMGATIELGVRTTLVRLIEPLGLVSKIHLEDPPPDWIVPKSEQCGGIGISTA